MRHNRLTARMTKAQDGGHLRGIGRSNQHLRLHWSNMLVIDTAPQPFARDDTPLAQERSQIGQQL
jgi:hypothetical protein